MDGPDVRWDGVGHRTICEWVNEGPGAALTLVMEDRLRSAAEALDYTGNLVSAALRKAGAEWRGSAAQAATQAMQVLRGFSDGLHFTSNVAGIRAFGQSDGASFARANVPPVVEVGPVPSPVGLPADVLVATVDYDRKLAAAKQAELRAREIMQQYTVATIERAAALTPLSPAPTVVLEFTDAQVPPGSVPGPGGGPGPVAKHESRVKPDNGPPASGPIETVSTSPAGFARGAGSGGEPVEPALSSERSGLGSPPGVGGRLPAAGAAAQSPGGSGHGRLGSDMDSRPPVSWRAGPGGADGGHRELGASGRPLAGRGPGPVGSGEPGKPVGPSRPDAAMGGTAQGDAVPIGLGGSRGDGRERRGRFAVPTAEHFDVDDEDPLRDPYQVGWFVAPEVLGDDAAAGQGTGPGQ